jgi:hypothetical protein
VLPPGAAAPVGIRMRVGVLSVEHQLRKLTRSVAGVSVILRRPRLHLLLLSSPVVRVVIVAAQPACPHHIPQTERRGHGGSGVAHVRLQPLEQRA